MNVLLTGSAGFIGRHLHRQLVDAGHDVCPVDIFDPHHPADCLDVFRSRTRYDIAIHLAAQVGGREGIDFHSAVLGARNHAMDGAFFDWALRVRPARVVYFSSAAAYPTMLQGDRAHPLTEGMIEHGWGGMPDSTYGWAKLTGELLATHARAAGLNVSVVRPFSSYAWDQDLDYPFPTFIGRGFRREDPFTIWGDGTATRDFIHVEDLCRAVRTMIDEGIDGPVNLGTGLGTSFNELAQITCDLVGYRPEFDHRLEKPVGVHTRVADASMLEGFCPPRISLEEGIAEALARCG